MPEWICRRPVSNKAAGQAPVVQVVSASKPSTHAGQFTVKYGQSGWSTYAGHLLTLTNGHWSANGHSV